MVNFKPSGHKIVCFASHFVRLCVKMHFSAP
jgi:hypothetical protein